MYASRWRMVVITGVWIAVAFVGGMRGLLAADEVRMMVDGSPAEVGDFKPGDIKELVLDNGLLKITFGKDFNDDFSAISVMKNGTELAQQSARRRAARCRCASHVLSRFERRRRAFGDRHGAHYQKHAGAGALCGGR